jgi:hypothetical protein
VLPVLISIKVWIFSKKSKDKVEELHKYSVHKRWDFLQIGIKKELPFAQYVIGMNVIKDFIIAPIIVLGIQSATV